jgi:cytochrome P450
MSSSSLSLPRGPRSKLRHTYSMLWGDPYRRQVELRRQYGDTFSMQTLAFGPLFCTANADGIKTLLTADADFFEIAISLILELFPAQGDGSLFKMQGARHRAARKLLAPPFHGARMRAYGALMRDTAIAFAQRLSPGKPFAMEREARAMTLDIIIRAIFGVVGEDRIQRFAEQITRTLAAFSPAIILIKALRRDFFGRGPYTRYLRELAALERLTMEEVAARRADPQPREDILSLLLQTRYDDGQPLSDVELFSQLLTFIAAGHETTAIALSWACYFLHRHPPALSRLREELRSVGPSLDPEAVAELPYLEAVCHETLRLRPVTPVLPRKLARPLTVQGYKLPAGMMLGIGILGAHLNPEVFPDPEAFRPERFLDRSYSPFEYLPFGGGPRRCIGAAFAMYEMKQVIAALLATTELRLIDDQPLPARLRGAAMVPRGGVAMVLPRRG